MKKIFLFLFTISICFSSCKFILLKCYGLKNPKNISEKKLIQVAKKRGYPNLFILDSNFNNYVESFKPKDSSTIKTNAQTCSSKDLAGDLIQPIQLFVFDDKDSLVSYFTNCYAGGFPNLKWNRDNNFSVFPPNTLTPIDARIKFDSLFQQLKYVYDVNEIEQPKKYKVIVFWNFFMDRQCRRLINYLHKSIKNRNDVIVYYVNNEAINFIE